MTNETEMEKPAQNDLTPLNENSRVVIVGAGLAGVRAAFSLREAGFTGSILLLSDEEHLPYDRPPLSKAVLMKAGEESRIYLTRPEELAAAKVELRLGARCAALHPVRRMVELQGGEAIGYDRLVLATGSSVRALADLPPGTDYVHYLRTLDDALRLRGAMENARKVAIIGAGVIGLEAAAVLADGTRSVLVIDPADRVMARAASPLLSNFLEDRHRAAGVDLRLGTHIATIDRTADGPTFTLSDGHRFQADLVLVGIGVVPNIALAEQAGLSTAPTGIMVDSAGRTSDPFIYAAGEIAWHFNDRLGRHDRQETWAHAAAHGDHVGRMLIDGHDPAYTEQSSYWTDQYDIAVQVFGTPIGERDVVRGNRAEGSFLIFHLKDDEVIGITSVNAARALRQGKKLLGQHITDLAALADPGSDWAIVAKKAAA